MDVFEVMDSCRAVRRFAPDPVPDDLIRKVIRAATRAPSPSNTQLWDFVVVRDAAVKARLAEAIGPTWAGFRARRPAPADPGLARMQDNADHLVRNLAAVPAIVFVCGANAYPPQAPDEGFMWSALYPAAQNLLLAARALGLGTTLTSVHRLAEAAVREILGLPPQARIAAMIPMGRPAQRFGPVRRRPVEEVLHFDRW